PTPIVIPIARAPQNVTRVAPRNIFAPPTRVASKPKHARKPREVPATTKIKLAAGNYSANQKGHGCATGKTGRRCKRSLKRSCPKWLGDAEFVSSMRA